MVDELIFKIKIQSISDVITNSSSETFVIGGIDIPGEALLEELKTVNKTFPRWFDVYENYQDYYKLPAEEKMKFETASGEGGIIEVWDWKKEMEYWMDWAVVEEKRDQVTPEIWALSEKGTLEELKKTLWVRIDEGYKNTINYFLKNYEIYEENCQEHILAKKDPKTGRVLENISYEEYKKLPKDEKCFADWWEMDETDN